MADDPEVTREMPPVDKPIERPTSKQFDLLDKAWRRIDRAHDCAPEAWTTMVSTPGWGEPDYIGSARWCCNVCAPMYAEAVTKVCGSVQTKVKR